MKKRLLALALLLAMVLSLAPAAAADTVAAELLAVSRYPAHFVCVCDDLWRGGEDYQDWTEVYVRGLAHVCRALAAEFDVVCDMAAGLPRVWKGAWPL